LVVNAYEQDALQEHRFWLQILGDHARFILSSLGSMELAEIKAATFFKQVFDQLLEQSRRDLSGKELMQLSEHANQYARQMRAFKLDLMREHLMGTITISLTPTFINHMVNELDEYLRILAALLTDNTTPLNHPVHHHLLWLLDATGHAETIAMTLDPTEKKLIHASDDFAKCFSEFYMKAVEMAGYLRTNLEQFPALHRFNKQVELEMLLFQEFLRELEEMELSVEVLGSFTPLMADHMFREECYYLTKLAQVTEVKKPNCNPANPRVEAIVG
jgi:hypothetical protein